MNMIAIATFLTNGVIVSAFYNSGRHIKSTPTLRVSSPQATIIKFNGARTSPRNFIFSLKGKDGEGDVPFFATVSSGEKQEDKITTRSPESRPTAPTRADEIMSEATDALNSVGWVPPMVEAELTSNDPFVERINLQIKAESGVGLDELLNPAKVVNLERDLYNLRSELSQLTEKNVGDVLELTTEECDGGGGGEQADAVRKKIEKKERDLLIERRSVFRQWLKNIFLGQAILSLGLSWFMVSNPETLFGRFDWFSSVNSIDVSIKVLGFWWWWLFIVPSLRSRRPSGQEKKALDIAFLGTPLVSILAPIATKDTELIWAANFVVVAGAYAFAFLVNNGDDDSSDNGNEPAWLKFVFKSLDFGTGRERGALK